MGGISLSLNSTLARLSAIESNFQAARNPLKVYCKTGELRRGLQEIIDENGMVTALRSGNDVVGVETIGGSSMKYCNVTVIDEGSIRKDRKQLYPTNEIEWTGVKFTLTNSGMFIAEGTYYGNGAQTNYLN